MNKDNSIRDYLERNSHVERVREHHFLKGAYEKLAKINTSGGHDELSPRRYAQSDPIDEPNELNLTEDFAQEDLLTSDLTNEYTNTIPTDNIHHQTANLQGGIEETKGDDWDDRDSNQAGKDMRHMKRFLDIGDLDTDIVDNTSSFPYQEGGETLPEQDGVFYTHDGKDSDYNIPFHRADSEELSLPDWGSWAHDPDHMPPDPQQEVDMLRELGIADKTMKEMGMLGQGMGTEIVDDNMLNNDVEECNDMYEGEAQDWYNPQAEWGDDYNTKNQWEKKEHDFVFGDDNGTDQQEDRKLDTINKLSDKMQTQGFDEYGDFDIDFTEEGDGSSTYDKLEQYFKDHPDEGSFKNTTGEKGARKDKMTGSWDRMDEPIRDETSDMAGLDSDVSGMDYSMIEYMLPEYADKLDQYGVFGDKKYLEDNPSFESEDSDLPDSYLGDIPESVFDEEEATEGAHGSGRGGHQPWMNETEIVDKKSDEDLKRDNFINRAEEILGEYNPNHLNECNDNAYENIINAFEAKPRKSYYEPELVDGLTNWSGGDENPDLDPMTNQCLDPRHNEKGRAIDMSTGQDVCPSCGQIIGGEAEEDEEWDESMGVHYGTCRGCGKNKNDLSNDDGYCSDCN